MPNLTIDLLPANTAPVATDILHSRTVGGVDEYLPLATLVNFMLGQDASKVVSADYDTLTSAGVYRNTFATHSPDNTATEYVVQVFVYTADAIQVMQFAVNAAGSIFMRTQNNSNVWTAWKVPGNPRTGTLVVAASNASAKSKAAADYICGGTDNDVQIQAAITYLASGGGYGLGGTVVLTEGTFNITTSILVKSNVSIKGQGNATVLKRMATNVLTIILIGSSITDFCLSNFKTDGNGLTYAGASIRALYCIDNTSNTNSCYNNISAVNNINVHDAGAFVNCTNMFQCYGEASSAGGASVYYACLNLLMCNGASITTGTGTTEGRCYYFCHNMSNCTGNAVDNGHGISTVALLCTGISNCAFTGTSSGGGIINGVMYSQKVSNCSVSVSGGTANRYAYSYADAGTSNGCEDTAAGGYNS